MTHGEEPGSEMHQDSAVLTYLEGLLMHQVAGGQGATATRRSEAGHGDREQSNKPVASYQLPNHGPNQEDRSVPLGGSTQHLKKARLLRSSEAWTEPESRRMSAPVGDLNGQSRELLTGALDGSPKCKGESTLLASLLQSFSSRLQSVALSQQIMQNLKQQDYPQSDESTPEEDEALRCFGSASSRLKGLLKKNKMQNHNSVPYRRRSSQERSSDSPQASQGSAQPASGDALSCAARLKAVASMVKHRSSPASSPKPSVACSQLALLLSSEAHLQQYSREQALKAQLSGRSASERLAAMATQQTLDNKQANVGQHQLSSDMGSPLNEQNGTLPRTTVDSSKCSPGPILGPSRSTSSPRALHPFREKRSFEKPNPRPSPNCSSLLLHLLNNHNTQRQTNGHSHQEEDYSVFPNHSSPLPSDSEYSNHENSFTKDISDAESSSSSCSPIDLSVKSRASGPMLGSSSSLDKLTESLISNWNPETPLHKITENRELKNSSVIKPHHKVTLLQLLLDHKNNEKVNKSAGSPDAQRDVSPKPSAATGRNTPISSLEDRSTRNSPDVMCFRKLQPLPTISQGRDSNGSASPYSLNLSPQVQATPLDLCKTKSHSGESAQESSFSASKLLQNLAQCGLQKSVPSPPAETLAPPGKRQAYELKTDKPVALLERLNAPLPRKTHPVLEEPHVSGVKSPFVVEPTSPSVSEIENLLEKRTVLQLLLGTTTTTKEKAGNKRKRPAAKGNALEKQSNQSLSHGSSNDTMLDVQIKTEPTQEVHVSEHDGNAEGGQREEQREGNGPLPVAYKHIKSEPFSSEAIPKDGLLSQLLKHQPGTYQMHKSPDVNMSNVKEGSSLHQGPAIPKKRKICKELTERLSCDVRPGSSAAHREASAERCASGPSEGRSFSSPVNRLEADALGPVGYSVSSSPPKDNKGFNVLKQLLLSDNCLKDLSQPRIGANPAVLQAKINGNSPNLPSYNHELATLQRNSSPQGLGPLDLKGFNAAQERSNPPISPWGYSTARQDSPKLNLVPVKREVEGPIQWVISGEDKHDLNRDSPRLTKSNPILYYMLQKGNSHINREGKEKRVEPLQCGMQVKIKEEPVSDLDAYTHRLNLKHHLQLHEEKRGSDTDGLNGTVEKC
ncbi:nuclear receptor-interacting protein 1 [Amia ocellicauda]|uniref:nuclear receptor-interacting protein 1 n=1 Tax=Amia ocellicauda TaxID=2972642 RepID=UPI003463A470|nr:NRIP1 protein [Amia calva]